MTNYFRVDDELSFPRLSGPIFIQPQAQAGKSPSPEW